MSGVAADGAGATWTVHCGDDANTETFSELTGVWVPDATAAPFIGAGNAPYVVRSAIATASGPGRPGIESWEALPSLGNVTGLEPGAVAVAGNGDRDIWAVGTGIFHRQPGP